MILLIHENYDIKINALRARRVRNAQKNFFSEKGHDLSHFSEKCCKSLKKKINSENTVSNEGCLYQNACDYIKMNVTISKCIQIVPTVLGISTRESATLVTLLREVL